MDTTPKTLFIYESKDGNQPFRDWLKSLRDKTAVARFAHDWKGLNRVTSVIPNLLEMGFVNYVLLLVAGLEFILDSMVIESLYY